MRNRGLRPAVAASRRMVACGCGAAAGCRDRSRGPAARARRGRRRARGSRAGRCGGRWSGSASIWVPTLRARAEVAGSGYVHRPMHIGKLGVHLWTGRFVVEDLVIEGLTPSDIPFFKARTISVALPWWRILLRREILIEDVELDGWQMQVDLLDNGGSTFPKFGSDQPRGPSRFTTTVRSVHAGRGQFTYNDVDTWTHGRLEPGRASDECRRPVPRDRNGHGGQRSDQGLPPDAHRHAVRVRDPRRQGHPGHSSTCSLAPRTRSARPTWTSGTGRSRSTASRRTWISPP